MTNQCIPEQPKKPAEPGDSSAVTISPQAKAGSNTQPSQSPESGAAALISEAKGLPITKEDGQASNEDSDPLVASGSQPQNSSHITDSEVRSILNQFQNSEEAIRKLTELVEDIQRRTKVLENWSRYVEPKPRFNPYPVRSKGISPKFELTTTFIYVRKPTSAPAEYFEVNPDQGHSFIRVLWTNLKAHPFEPTAVNPTETFTPESADILQFSIESQVTKDYLDELSDTIIRGDKPIGGSYMAKLKVDDDSLSFHKPFRWLIQHRHLIEEKVKSLEENQTCLQEHRSDASVSVEDLDLEKSNASQPGGTSGHDGNERTDSASEAPDLEDDLLSQLRHLLAFMKEHLATQLQRYDDARAGKLRTVRFQDLWMLYKPGDLIYTPSRRAVDVFDYENPVTRRVRKPHRPGSAMEGHADDFYHDVDTSTGQVKRQIAGTETPQAYKITAVMGGLPLPEPVGSRLRAYELYHPLKVVRYYVDFDGTRYHCVCDPITFTPFDGEKDIIGLEAYPLAYAPDPTKPLALGGVVQSAPGETAMREFLKERGRRFVQVSEASHMFYEGPTVGQAKEVISTAVVIDLNLAYTNDPALQPQAYLLDSADHLNVGISVPPREDEMRKEIVGNFKSDGSYSRSHGLSQRYDWYERHQRALLLRDTADLSSTLNSYPSVSLDTPDAIQRLTDVMMKDELVYLLPGTVYAYALRSRKWVSLDLRLVRPADNIGSWDDLILPSGLKGMVEAIVETHLERSRSTAHLRQTAEVDIVHGKGNGCIILLHGEPGVGKTSTAECVAAFTKRPLLPITCGDIGYEPSEVERSLENHFTLAHRWGGVVLLDEADVFLGKRSRDDLKRSGLVSVFLRVLEYYHGILFLTTNRVGSFDDAFRSRLHLTLYYPKLERKQTVAIWKVNLRRLRALNEKRREWGQEPIEVQSDSILKFAKKNWETLSWNGRQIRNAFQTAVALAEFDAIKINKAAAAATGEGGGGGKKTPVPPVMTKKHFQAIAESSMQFDNYLYLAHGRSDESANAKRDQVRWDYGLGDRNRNQQQEYQKRLGGNRKLSLDSSSSDDSSSSESDGGASYKSTSTTNSVDSDDDNSEVSSDSSGDDNNKKRKKKSSSSSKDKGKSKKEENKWKKHRSRKEKH